jgi:hypothetical protein
MVERGCFFPPESIFDSESDVRFCLTDRLWERLTAGEAGRNRSGKRASRSVRIDISAKRRAENLKSRGRGEDIGCCFCAEVSALEKKGASIAIHEAGPGGFDLLDVTARHSRKNPQFIQIGSH